MKQNAKFFTIGALFMMIVMSTFSGFAETISKTIEVTFNSVNLKVNGKSIQADNILYNETTYVPIRAVANMFDKEVGWDEKTNTASIDDKKISNQGDNKEFSLVTVGDKEYIGFSDIEVLNGCFFKVTDTNKLDLYRSYLDYSNGEEPILTSVPNIPIKNKNNVATLGIDYNYYKNILIDALTAADEGTNSQNNCTKEGLTIKNVDGVEFVSISSIATKHDPKAAFSYYNNKLSLFLRKDRPILLIDNVPFKTIDSIYYVEYKYYEEKIYPLIK